MSLRTLVLSNFRWKVTALLLAMLVWVVIKFAIYRGTGRNQVLMHQPVMVLKSPDDPRIFRIQPPEVTVVLQANKEVRPTDVEAFIDLTSIPDVATAFKRVLVRGADAPRIVDVKPPGVIAERVGSLDFGTTNSLRRP